MGERPSYMDLVKRAHAMHNALAFIDLDYNIDPYFGVWYAEEQLYIIRDCMTDAYYFVLARNPRGAIGKVKERIEMAESAGKMCLEVEQCQPKE